MDVLLRDKLGRNRFNGVREHRLVWDQRIADGRAQDGAWQGLGNFVYLADARFVPGGETGMHDHRNIDVISVMLEGRLLHQGSLENGSELAGHSVLVQRAGSEGFSHNEINPDEVENRMLQLWVLPEQRGGAADHRLFHLDQGRVTRVYGGTGEQTQASFAARTCVDIAWLRDGQSIDIDKPALIYLCQGGGFANEDNLSEGALVRGDQVTFDATEDTCLVMVHEEA